MRASDVKDRMEQVGRIRDLILGADGDCYEYGAAVESDVETVAAEHWRGHGVVFYRGPIAEVNRVIHAAASEIERITAEREGRSP